MKRMNNQKKFALKPTVASTLLALLGVAGLPAMADEAAQKAAEAAGKRVDNARVLDKAIASPGEWQPDFTYPLPSGVSRSDVQAMRAAAEPKGAPQASELVSDDMVGALFASGKADLLPAAYQQMDALVARYQGKRGLRFAVVGHTDNQRLSANTRRIFRDNPGLSEARALAVATYLREKLNLPAAAVSIRGMGEAQPVASNGTPEGMARNRRVEVKFWHEEMPVPAVAAPRLPCAPDAAQADLPFRVTVDGEPVRTGEGVNEADRQRCTDVALERSDIQIKYDDLAAKPLLNAWVEKDLTLRGEAVRFRGWSNYVYWIKRAEVRIFLNTQKTGETPLAVVPLEWEKTATWTVPREGKDEYAYVLRVYDAQGRFDETARKSLNVATTARPLEDMESDKRESLTGWGENSLAVSNIPVRGGTVTVSGRKLSEGEQVQALGLPVPVGDNGRFVLRQILPAGPHSLAVQVTEADGRTATYHRNVSIPTDDWFYIAVGDLTIGRNQVSGPAQLVTGDDTKHYEQKTYIDGRGAFYLKGKIKGDWLLTAAADTREQPLEHLFSNFSSKDPRYLLRNIDPDAYYPVYGDDSTTVDDAPTQGKFYVRLEKGDSHIMWGNFRTSWTGSELVQYSRGLYGGRLLYRSEDSTSFGERRSFVEGFAADPGTLGTREEFRATGGSLYYLHHQDLTVGSERLWIEIRDRDSGMVIERRPLSPAQDYEINYLQGRVVLRDALPSTASGGGLIRTTGLSGNPVYLVTTYEFTPGVSAIDTLATGARATHWLNDNLQIGLTGYHQGQGASKQTLKGIDVTGRLAAGTSLKVEVAQSSGAGDGMLSSIDGGFGFNSQKGSTGDAMAKRVELQANLAELKEGAEGRVSAYWQDREEGFSGPGQIAYNGEASRQVGVQAEVTVGKDNKLKVKADSRRMDSQDVASGEASLRMPVNPEWGVSVGARHDKWDTHVPNASRILSRDGSRTDVVVMADYAPLKEGGQPGEKVDWEAYAFVQGTAHRDGTREANNRAGLGGRYRVNDRFTLNAEASDGNLGVGGMIGGDYRISDRSNAYLNYRLETESPDVTYRGSHGTWISGANYRVSEEMRVFGETRMENGSGPEGLTQAFGVDLSPNDRWNFGTKIEFGSISDPLAGDMRRRALGVSAGYKFEKVKFASAIEYRNEQGESGINDGITRRTWLMRNTLGYQVDPAWRLLGKFNFSRSANSQGAFYDGNFREFVAAAAYRPIDNDRWNTLLKYTNFYNVPSSGQLAPSGSGIADYAQRSQVFSVDTIWDVKPWLSLGAKYGLRIGELKDRKAGGEWFSSRADLIVLRADWHFVREWDAVLEWRNLRVKEADDARSGALLAIYRHVGQNVKAGLGYNFTDYSDDLTDLSYRSKGWFINVLSTF